MAALPLAARLAAAALEPHVKDFFAQHCTSCHNQKVRMASLAIDEYLEKEQPLADVHVWETIVEKLSNGEMPPKGAPRPEQTKITEVAAWIEKQLAQAAARAEPDPGRVTARRLNRVEYNNTIRDLMFVNFRPADDFPADDTGYGFDNIGDVLTISPVLMEKYLRAAEKIVQQAIVTERKPPEPTVSLYSAPRSRNDVRQIGSTADIPYSPEGRLSIRHGFPATGEYRLRLRYVDRRRRPPRRPEWMSRLPELIEKLSAVEPTPVDIDRVREVLGLERPDAFRFLREFDAKRKGDTFVIGHAELIAAMQEKHAWVLENPEPPPPPPPPSLPVIFTLDGKELDRYSANDNEYQPVPEPLELRIEAGERELHAEILDPDGNRWNPNAQDWKEYRRSTTEKAERMVFVDSIEIQGPYDAEAPPLPESHRRILFCGMEESEQTEDCARRILSRMARRAYRRPVSADEVNGLLRFWTMAREEGESFASGIQVALQAMLVSPHFLFRIENDPEPGDPDNIRRISDLELATRLSYFLWSSMPDEELFSLAEQNKLREPGALEAQVRRMLAGPKSKALVENFAGQWLQLRNLDIADPDPELFPEFDEQLRRAMRKETELFFEEILCEDRSLLDFLDANYTYLNGRLAEHYGIEGIEGDEFRRVELGDKRRGGLLSQASVLTISSYPRRTSPVQRGLWVLENLLAAPPPPPPADVPELDEEAVGTTGSLREQLEQHRANAACAVCHERMDNIGFGLEHYNPVGAWRAMDGKFPIDSAGELPGGMRFSGPGELKAILRDTEGDRFVRALTEKLLTYGLGRGLERFDKPVVDSIAKSVAQKGYRFSELILEVVNSMPFQMRKGEEKRT